MINYKIFMKMYITTRIHSKEQYKINIINGDYRLTIQQITIQI